MGTCDTPGRRAYNPKNNKITEKQIKNLLYKKSEFFGFLCNKNFPERSMMLSLLIIKGDLKYINSLLSGKNLKFYLNEKEYKFSIDISRNIYKSKKYNILIIEIEKEDGFTINLEIDEKNYDNSLKFKFLSNIELSNIKIIKKDNFLFEPIPPYYNPLEGIILNKSNYKVIGMLCKLDRDNNKIGIFINPLIDEFLNYKKEQNLFEYLDNKTEAINESYNVNDEHNNIYNKITNITTNNIIKKNNLKDINEKKNKVFPENDNKEIKYNINSKDIISEDIKNNEKEINLVFKLNEKKKLFLEIKKDIIFKDAITALKRKYLWLENIKNIYFKFEGNKILNDKTVKELGLKDNSIIEIIEKEE